MCIYTRINMYVVTKYKLGKLTGILSEVVSEETNRYRMIQYFTKKKAEVFIN